MDSRWHIPPFRGNKKTKSSEKSKKSEPFEEESQKKNRNLPVPERNASKAEELSEYKSKVTDLQENLRDLEEEQQAKIEVLAEEKKEILNLISALEKKHAEKHENESIKERINSQKEEIEKIRSEINHIKLKIDQINDNEETLILRLRESKEDLKNVQEEYYIKERENHLFGIEYRNSLKEANEQNERLNLINKLENKKGLMINEFINKISTKHNREQAFDSKKNKEAIKSEFRILKLQINEIEKEIKYISESGLFEISSAVLQNFDFTETF